MTKLFAPTCKPNSRQVSAYKIVAPHMDNHKLRTGKKICHWKNITLTGIIALMCLVLLLAGCERDPAKYYGNYPEAYTIAINNLIGATGSESIRCGVVEEDDYGRIMYYYWAPYDGIITADFETEWKSFARCAVLICQRSENESVFFYPNYSFISFPVENPWATTPPAKRLEEKDYLNEILKAVSEDELRRLKDLNDWNKPFDEAQCTRLEISYKSRENLAQSVGGIFVKDDGLVKKSQIEEFYSKIHTESVKRLYYVYLTSDDYNRHIYFARGLNSNDIYTEPYVMLFNPDGSYDMKTGYLEMKDLYSYQDVLKEFKEQNNWNKPI